jgi:hypothetical protein
VRLIGKGVAAIVLKLFIQRNPVDKCFGPCTVVGLAISFPDDDKKHILYTLDALIKNVKLKAI